ncbi:MAG TPA: hypothetical protein VKG92_07035 [Flavobacteriales bacterium]|nr:hypothetical protein [Flavobacteriales bacterium]
MRTFLRHLAVFSILPALAVLAILLKLDGRTDERYLRYTTPPQTSLILGSSRAAIGLRPHVLDSVLGAEGHDIHSYNFSFAIGFSSYGPAYYGTISRKLDPTARNGVFILSVDPWTISCRKDKPPSNDRAEDATSSIGHVRSVSADPNIDYLLNIYDHPLLTILLPDQRPKEYAARVGDDGLLEMEVSMQPAEVERRTIRKVKEYREDRLPLARPSALRLGYLGLTIDLLKEHGTVVLVRMPVSSGIQAVEDRLMPGFSATMARMADERQVRFIDLYNAPDEWTFIDGDHLTASSGRKATAMIANDLLHPPGPAMDGSKTR